MHEQWCEALNTGLHDSGLDRVAADRVTAVTYANCFRSAGTKSIGDPDDEDRIPAFGLVHLRDPLELELLEAFASGVPDPEGSPTKGLPQDALRRLQRSRFLGDPPAKVIIWMIKQVRDYLTDDALRRCVQDRFAAAVTPGTRVVVAHSLGSVVAYETLLAHPEWKIDTLVTIGSPLGLKAIGDRLRPPVSEKTPGAWPGVRRWLNVAAEEDPVALVKKLKPLYGKDVEDLPVLNGRLSAHLATRYLTTHEVANGIADALRPR
ncbi:alpha/beta hydrolase [Actinocorallia longicatena]